MHDCRYLLSLGWAITTMIRDIGAAGSERLVLIIRAAYWGAVLLIAAMAMGSFLLVQSRLEDHRHDDALLGLISQQKALSQRILFLANAADAVPLPQKAPLADALSAAVDQFEQIHADILQRTQTIDGNPGVGDGGASR